MTEHRGTPGHGNLMCGCDFCRKAVREHHRSVWKAWDRADLARELGREPTQKELEEAHAFTDAVINTGVLDGDVPGERKS